MNNEDILTSPYAHWLEQVCESAMEMRPIAMGVCMMDECGAVLTGYYGDLCPQDKALMAFHFNTDAMFEVMKANAKEIVEAAEEEDDTEEEDDDS